MSKKRKPSKKKTPVSWGLLFFEVLGWLIVAGMLLVIYNTNKVITLIQNAQPVTQLTAETTGIVRLEGLAAAGEGEVTEQGVLRNTYALLQKEAFLWSCSRGAGCDYKVHQPDREIWGSLSVNGIKAESDRYVFYKGWLALNRLTVEPEYMDRIYEGGTARPLREEEHESRAYGYHTVSVGEPITVIGRAVDGRIEPIKIWGKEEPAVLIADNMEQMIAKEKEAQKGYILVGSLVLLLLLPVMIGRIRRWKANRR